MKIGNILSEPRSLVRSMIDIYYKLLMLFGVCVFVSPLVKYFIKRIFNSKYYQRFFGPTEEEAIACVKQLPTTSAFIRASDPEKIEIINRVPGLQPEDRDQMIKQIETIPAA